MGQTAYFDNAATTYPKPDGVYDAMDDFYRHHGDGSAGRGAYAGARDAGRLLADVRQALGQLFHTEQHTAVLTSSATEALNLVLQGQDYAAGETVYISPFEHNAVLRPLHVLQQQTMFYVEHLAVARKTLTYDLAAIEAQFAMHPPRLVVLSHASNVCGAVAPAADIFACAKRAGAMTVLDMAQTAGLIDLDLVAAQADAAIFAGHKTLLGPFGAAGVMLRKGIRLRPLLYGGTGVDSANPDMPGVAPLRYEAGSRNMLAAAGLRAALGYIEREGIDTLFMRERKARECLLALLAHYDFIHPIVPEQGIGVISATFDGLAPDEAGKILGERGIAVRTGLHCAPEAHRFLGTFPAGTVRFSVSAMTGSEDFERLRAVLDEIAEEL